MHIRQRLIRSLKHFTFTFWNLHQRLLQFFFIDPAESNRWFVQSTEQEEVAW